MKSGRLQSFLSLVFVCAFTVSLSAQKVEIKEVVKSQSEFANACRFTSFGTDTMAFLGYSRYEDLGPFWFSTDQGNTWRCKGYEPTSLEGSAVVRTLIMDLETILLNHETKGLILSTDSGETFTELTAPSNEQLNRILKFGPNILLEYIGSGNSYLSQDTCKTFLKMNSLLPGDVVYEKGGHVIIRDALGKDYMESKDYGLDWERLEYRRKPESSLAHLTDSIIYTYNGNTLKWSTDRLQSIDETLDIELDSTYTVREIKFFNRYIGYLTTFERKLFKTYDGGKTWNEKYVSVVETDEIDIRDVHTVAFHNFRYFNENPVLYITNNGAERLSLGSVEGNAMRVFPNPATNTVSISQPAFDNALLTIMSTNGQVVHESPFSKQTTLALEGWQTGVYFIRLTGNEQSQHYLIQVL